jgi:Fe-S cluster assembly protein SufD
LLGVDGPTRFPRRPHEERSALESFTPAAAASLVGPEWLADRRRTAAESALAAGVPTADEEVWRYSRIGELDLDRYTPFLPQGQAPAGLPAPAREVLDAVGPVAGFVVLCNGRVLETHLDQQWADRGVFLGPLVDADEPEAALGVAASPSLDVFGSLNDAFAPEPVLVRIPRGVVVEAPIVVVQWTDTDQIASFARLVVQAGENSQADIVDYEASSDVDAFSAPVVELDVGPAARVGYVNIQDLGPRVWRIGGQVSQVERDATLVAAQAALGATYGRTRADCRLVGRGATGNLVAVYFGQDDQMLDFRTFQDHRAPDTTSDLLFKGAVADRSRSVYTGLIRVRPDARGTNAFQTNRNIKLGEHAWAESVPNLEIENNDVHCSHASTVGPIDEEQRFYLESRGVPPEAAERLIVAGFFDEVLGRLPVAGLAPMLRARLVDRLKAKVAA